MLIGLDIGTSGARALAVSESGEVIAAAAQEYPLLARRPGGTEQNPDDWWQASCKVLTEVRLAAVPAAEGPAYGAALLAGVTAGRFKTVNEPSSMVRLRPDFAQPNNDNAQLYSRYLRVDRDLYSATGAAMARLSELSAYK